VQHSTHWNGLFKAARDIQKTYGISALFKGHSATLVRIFPYASINFLAYEQLRAAVIVSSEKETLVRRFWCGSVAGATSTFVTYPLELIRTRLAFETVQKNPSSWLGISQKIYYEGGGSWRLANFYRGFGPTMLGILPYAGMSFMTHDVIKDWFRSPALAPYTLQPQSRTQLTAVAQLCCGALAGIVAQTSSYPIEIIRRRMQVGNVVGSKEGILETAQRIFRERGVRGFYVGLTIGYVKIVPMVATSFYVYDRMKRFLGLVE
jgi:solute carrier family 25 protein 16